LYESSFKHLKAGLRGCERAYLREKEIAMKSFFGKDQDRSRKIGSKGLILLLVFMAVGANSMALPVAASATQTITLKSGNGAVGERDALNQFSLDGGQTYQDAFIVTPNPAYTVIPGTQYISRSADLSGPENTATRFRTLFTLPAGYSNPSISVDVYADNVATVFVNGKSIGAQTFAEIFANFQNQSAPCAENDPTAFHAGVNTLEFEVHNFTSIMALDYKAVVTYEVTNGDTMSVDLDIKPTSCPNPLKPGEKGLLPVAVLGTAQFDVSQIDPASVKLEGVAPVRSDLEDVATPYEPNNGGTGAMDCHTLGPDGVVDVTFKFDHRTVVATLGNVTDGQVLILKLTGNLKAEFGGTPFEGQDVVIIRLK
jgi:hypothetical protein